GGRPEVADGCGVGHSTPLESRQPSSTSQNWLQQSPFPWQGAPSGRQQLPETQVAPEQQSVARVHWTKPSGRQQTLSVHVVELPQHSSRPPHVLPNPVQQTEVCCTGVTAQSPEQHVAPTSHCVPSGSHGIVVVVVVCCETVMTAFRDVLRRGVPWSVAVKVIVCVPGLVGTQLKLARAGRSSSGVKLEPGG